MWGWVLATRGNPKILVVCPGYFDGLIFRGAHFRRELLTEGIWHSKKVN